VYEALHVWFAAKDDEALRAHFDAERVLLLSNVVHEQVEIFVAALDALIAMLAHALLAVLAPTELFTDPQPGLIAFTCNEIARLLNRLITAPTRGLAHILIWTDWRRRHQHRARSSHYRIRPET
jgi:hypothetical protein